MATPLSEMQFELLPHEDADAGEAFGLGLDVSVDEDGFTPGSDDWQDQDAENPTRGGTTFGRDRLAGPTWAWDLFVNEHDVISARRTLSRFRTAWRAMHIRDEPNVVIPLRYRLGDEYRRIYGRPRGFEAPPNNMILSGFVPIQCDFKAVDGFVYDDTMSQLTLGLQGTSEGGFIFPVTFPVVTMPVGEQRAQAVVGGDAKTYPIVRFDGPVTNPRLVTSRWTLGLDVAIPVNEYVEVDLRPWRLTALRNGTTSVAGALSKRTRLSDLYLEPGRPEMTYRGSLLGGQSTCQVRWAAAHNSI